MVFNLFFLLLWLFLFFLDFYETFFDKFLTHLCHVYSCKDVRGIFFHFSAVCKQTEFVEVVILSNSRTALLNDFFRRRRHKRIEQTCANHDSFRKVIEHGCKAVLLGFVLCKHPRHGFVYILVGTAQKREYVNECVRGAVFVHIAEHPVASLFGKRFEFVVDGLANALIAHDAAEILVGHCDCALHEVAVNVDKFAIDSVHNDIPADNTVIVERHLRKEEISHRVHAEIAHQIVRVNDVAL